MKKYEIQSITNDPANTKMRIYKQGQPVADIYEEDLYECLNDSQCKQFENGKYEFRTLPITKIRELSTKNYYRGY